MSNQVVRLKPFHYIHVKDLNQGSIRVVTGPRTFTTEEYEEGNLGIFLERFSLSSCSCSNSNGDHPTRTLCSNR